MWHSGVNMAFVYEYNWRAMVSRSCIRSRVDGVCVEDWIVIVLGKARTGGWS
jgi:hypothetical protein